MLFLLWKLSRRLISGYNVKWQMSDRRGLYAVPTPLVRGALATVCRARELWPSGEPGSSTYSRPAPLTRAEALSCLRTTWTGVSDQPTMPGLPRATATNSFREQLRLLPLE